MIIMVKNEKLDSYRMMKLWINEMPDDCKYIEGGDVCVYEANKDIAWFNGILCLELRLAPRAASNYAMLNFKFVGNNSGVFKVIYKLCEDDDLVASNIAVQNDIVRNGTVKKYYSALRNTFNELSIQNIYPSGILEVLGGRHGYTGSSDIAVIIVAKILVDLFKLGDKFEKSDLKSLILEGCKKKL